MLHNMVEKVPCPACSAILVIKADATTDCKCGLQLEIWGDLEHATTLHFARVATARYIASAEASPMFNPKFIALTLDNTGTAEKLDAPTG
jgi:hypothetical protein